MVLLTTLPVRHIGPLCRIHTRSKALDSHSLVSGAGSIMAIFVWVRVTLSLLGLSEFCDGTVDDSWKYQFRCSFQFCLVLFCFLLILAASVALQRGQLTPQPSATTGKPQFITIFFYCFCCLGMVLASCTFFFLVIL